MQIRFCSRKTNRPAVSPVLSPTCSRMGLATSISSGQAGRTGGVRDLDAYVIPVVGCVKCLERRGDLALRKAGTRWQVQRRWLALVASLLLVAPAAAQEWQARTIHVVVPYPAGGPAD